MNASFPSTETHCGDGYTGNGLCLDKTLCCSNQGHCGSDINHCGVENCIGGCDRKKEGGYNGDHFWSNFELADFSFFRSRQYMDYFEHLDNAGGFFYERWGDAPVHTLAVGMFLQMNEVHYFRDIGYRHSTMSHCPTIPEGCALQCACKPSANGSWSQDLTKVRWFL